MTSSHGDDFLPAWREQVDHRLAHWIDELGAREGCPPALAEAMRYALLGPGKRLRPLLCLAAARAAGGDERAARDAACALELVHAYSLVHDDLPAMDDDAVRRGRPTCHRRFGEALAILAGDALLTGAFEVLVRGLEPARAAEAVGLLARAAGCAGMVGGQADDVDPALPARAEAIESVHLRKTARLMEVACSLGALCAGADPRARLALERFGRGLGLAFQLADDILSAEGDAQALGRPGTTDAELDRRTFPRLIGLAETRERAAALLARAIAELGPLGPRAEALRALARAVAARAKVVLSPKPPRPKGGG